MVRHVGAKVARGYQERMAGEVDAAMRAGSSGTVLAPTGAGKTLLIAMAAADARAQGRPVLILSPTAGLAKQVVEEMWAMPEFAGVDVHAFVAANERLEVRGSGGRVPVMNRLDSGLRAQAGEVGLATPAGLAEACADPRMAAYAAGFGAAGGVVVSGLDPASLDPSALDDAELDAAIARGAEADPDAPAFRGGLNVATTGSLRNKEIEGDAGEAFRAQIAAFAAAGGVVLVDEGQVAGAKELSKVLDLFAEGGATCIQYSATPWREDGKDPMGRFVDSGLIAAATYAEVRAAGQVVPTRFKLANEGLTQRLGEEKMVVVHEIYEAMVAEGKDPEKASGEAFGKFFKPDATPAEREIGRMLKVAMADVWEAEAPGRGVAMFHCDRVLAAEAIAAEVAGRRMPFGHPRQGLPARVACVVDGDTRLFEDGREVDLRAVHGWRTPAQRRDGVIAMAREERLDVLVNVNALGTGTDIPAVDLNILAAYRRSLSAVRQTEGRGARAHPGKADQVFVDLGTSMSTHWPELKAFAEGRDECVDPRMLRIDARVLAEMHAWASSDPGLDAQCDVELEARTRHRRDPEVAREVADPAFEAYRARPARERTPAPTPVEVRPGLAVASTYEPKPAPGPEGRSFEKRMAFFMEGGVVVVLEQPSGRSNGFMTDDPAKARDFAAFSGVRARAPSAKPVTDERRAAIAALDEKDRRAGRPGGWLPAATEGEAAAQLDARYHLRAAVVEAARVIGRRLFPADAGLEHPVATMVLDRPEAMGLERVAMTRRYLAMARTQGRPVEVLATDAAGTRAARAAFGDLPARTGSLGRTDAGTRGRIALDLEAGLVAGWRADGRDGRNRLRKALGLAERLDAKEEAADARFAERLRRLRHVDAEPSAGRYADLGDARDLAHRLLAGQPPRSDQEALTAVVRHLGPALVALPPASQGRLRREAVADAGKDVFGKYGGPRPMRLALDRDVARQVFATSTPAAREAALGALSSIAKRQVESVRRVAGAGAATAEARRAGREM